MKTWSDFNIEIRPGATGNYYTTCPQCSHARKNKKAKCLSVNIEKGVWICHHCDWRGTLAAGAEAKSNPHAWIPKTFRKPTYKKPETDLPRGLVKWFEGRGISEATLKRNHIGAEMVYMPQVEKEVMAMRFPFYRKGEVVNVKSRDDQKNFRLESGAERIFYGMDDVDGTEAIIVEGEIDKLSCEMAGFRHTISVPDGAPSPKAKDYTSKFDFLENCEEFIAGLKRIILAVDNDEPGKVLEEELARRLGRARCYRIQWTEGCKDANEVLQKHGTNALARCLSNAKPYPVKGIFEVTDIAPNIESLFNDGYKRGDSTGWPCLTQLYTARPGEWTLVTGIPGHGKSEFLDALMVNLASLHGWTFAVFSPENQPLERHFAKLAEKYVGKPFVGKDRMGQEDIAKAKAWLNERFVFLLPDEDNLSVDAVLELTKTTVMRKGVKGVVIDPWNELDHQRDRGMAETDYISQSLTKIRRFARTYGVHVWLVVHPAKLMKNKDGTYPVPTPYDCSGSAHWRNKADNCITVFRSVGAEKASVEVHVQKIRFKEIGRVGACALDYDVATGRYSDPEHENCPY